MQNIAHKNKLAGSQIKGLAEIWGEIGEKSFSQISGFSMWPLIKPGDSLVIDHKLDEIKLGDIVVFKHKDTLISHRVVKRINKNSSETIFLTKGDHNCRIDSRFLSLEDILGRAVKINGRNRSSFLWRLTNKIVYIYSYYR